MARARDEIVDVLTRSPRCLLEEIVLECKA